jgi:hypothetical protein
MRSITWIGVLASSLIAGPSGMEQMISYDEILSQNLKGGESAGYTHRIPTRLAAASSRVRILSLIHGQSQ